MDNEKKEHITLAEFINDYGWDFFVSRQYTEEMLRYEIREQLLTKPEFLAAKDAYLAELSESMYQHRLHHDPFCMRLRSELGIPDPYLMR